MSNMGQALTLFLEASQLKYQGSKLKISQSIHFSLNDFLVAFIFCSMLAMKGMPKLFKSQTRLLCLQQCYSQVLGGFSRVIPTAECFSWQICEPLKLTSTVYKLKPICIFKTAIYAWASVQDIKKLFEAFAVAIFTSFIASAIAASRLSILHTAEASWWDYTCYAERDP